MGIFTFKNIFADVTISGITESVLPPLILNMTITGSVVILFVLLARLALKKAPKIFSYALWVVVLFRLLCPVSITTDFSLLGLFDTPAVENTQHTTAVEYIPYDVVHTPDLEVQLPVPPAINDAVNDTLPQEHAALGADPLEGKFAIGSLIWLLGIAAMAIYSAVSYILLRRKLVGAVLLRDNIYLADGIDSPFVMGLFRPKIYLPSALSEQEQGYIILHEQHHIRRGDHITKALAFIALCIHWFNPLVWVAFVLSSKDMEMSCDEAVVKKLGEGIRADYSASLLSLATGRRIIAGTPLAFGEGDTKSRIKNMLSWKHPRLWVTVCAAVICLVIAVVCASNPQKTAFADWMKHVTVEEIDVASVYNASGEIPKVYDLTDEDIVRFVDLLHTLEADTIRYSKGDPMAKDYHLFLKIENREFLFRCADYPSVTMTFDSETGPQMEPAGKACWIDSAALYDFIMKLAEQVVLPTEEALNLAEDVSYYLELAAGTEFQNMNLDRQTSILVEYEDLLEDYTLIARESKDGTTAYIVGQYNGNPLESPLHGMYSIDMYTNEEEYFRFLYREDEAETVEAVVAANQTEFPPSAGYRIEDSQIIWTDNSGCILIQPKTNELLLGVPWNRYFYTPNGREYMIDAISRGIDVCGRTDTFLYIYRISERFGEISERIALTEAEAQAILAEERVKITDGFGFSASLHIDGQTTYYNEREGIPQTVLDLAVEKCDYRFGDPSYITDTIREARLDCDWLDTTLYADEADLPRLREILKNAEHGYVGSCGYGAKLTLTFTGGEKLTVFKGCDGCDTIVFGSYGGYFLGDKENIEFWEMFGLDPDTKVRIETNPASAKDEVLRLFNEHPWRGATFHSRDYAPSNVVFGSPDTVTKIGRVFSSAQWEYAEAPESEPAWENLIEMYPFVFYDRNGLVRYGGPMKDSTPWDEPPMEEAVWYRAPGVFEAMEEATDTHFVENHDSPTEPTAPPSETDIHNALMSNYTVMHDESEATRPYRTEAHHIWDVRQDGNTANVYALVNFTTYGWDNGRQKRIAWWDGPAKLTFTWSNGWQLTDFWRWTEDEQYETAIQNRFPANVAEIALGPMDSDISASMNTRTYEAAAAYYATQSGLSVYQPFTPADEEFTGQALVASQDVMSYEERLEWIQTVTSYEQDRNYISLNQYQEGAGCIAYTGQWVGTPHMDQYTLGIRFADGTTASLPLPRNGYWGSALPDTMRFEGGKFVYEKAFPTEEVTNEGETLIHLKGTYHYEVDLAAKTVSLTVLQ